ncbi:putative DNA-directed RNA polymerase III [Viridothelium virens]|uniref:DNA-directed RNA polymerase subunit n=1 Tax=Viridothelium virens TaxID=1048519 RepID=A0A6A6GTV2_VIRVR|nr:putative DNA-directed RNA polymerase III [Viridothelium virens]
MFTVAVIEDLIEIKPEDFDLLSIQALEDGIHAKYADRVIQGVGLCICLWDLLEASEGRIGNGTGIAHVNTRFRMVVFRPFKGEVIQGQIRRNVKGVGLQLSLDFFDDIWVPCPIGLPKPSSFDESEGVWMWNSQNGDAAYDESEQVRFRVEREVWNNQTLSGPPPRSSSTQREERRAPYIIIASMTEDGLGPIRWWDEEAEGEEGEEEVEGVEAADGIEVEGQSNGF